MEVSSIVEKNHFVSVSWSKPLYILSHSNAVLREAIIRDASFLEKSDVMDYSLLVGLNSKDNLLVLGIIGRSKFFIYFSDPKSQFKNASYAQTTYAPIRWTRKSNRW